MAIGLGKMLGFNFPRNFNYPYISRSISEFWRRWHITLGSWFKEYVYIPLGGNRVKKYRIILNLFLVWLLTGFWHGASYNFILWRLLFFLLISIEKFGFRKFLNNHKFISHVYVIFFLLMGWTLFAITDLSMAKDYIIKLFTMDLRLDIFYYLRNYAIILMVATIFSTPIIEKIYKKIINIEILKTIVLIIIFLISVAYLVDSTYNPFLYFRF